MVLPYSAHVAGNDSANASSKLPNKGLASVMTFGGPDIDISKDHTLVFFFLSNDATV